MRILAAHPGPNFSVHDVYVGWVEALRQLGVHVLEFNLADRLTFYDNVLMERDGEVRKALSADAAIGIAMNGIYSALYQAHADVLLSVSGFFTDGLLLEKVRAHGTKVVLLHTESPYEDGRQLELAQHADLNLINDPTNLRAFRAVARTEYVPHSYRPHIHCPGPADPKLAADLAFVGTGYPSRIAYLERMDLVGLDVLLAGNWQDLAEDSPLRPFVAHEPAECLDNVRTVDVYRSASVSLNLYRREAEAEHLAAGWAMGPREVELAATATFFLRDSRPEGDEVLSMLPTITDPGDASEKLRYWLARPGARQDLAAKARAAVEGRTFTARATDLLRWLEKEK
jgi:spore maturation protein CgeB